VYRFENTNIPQAARHYTDDDVSAPNATKVSIARAIVAMSQDFSVATLRSNYALGSQLHQCASTMNSVHYC
jgi:hypothetical protein